MVNETVSLVSSSNHCRALYLMSRDNPKALKGPVSNRASSGRTNCAEHYRIPVAVAGGGGRLAARPLAALIRASCGGRTRGR